MNKGQLVAKISREAKVSKTAANAVLDSFINTTMTTLKKGDKVVFTLVESKKGPYAIQIKRA